MNYLLSLPINKLRFYFIARQPIRLPWYKGATFRGAFGQTFARTVCLYPRKICSEECPIANQCAYYYIFETPNTGALPEFVSEKAPQPFVLEPPLTEKRMFLPGEEFTIDLIIIGKAIEHLPYFIYCFDRMGETPGVGKWTREGFGRYEIEKVTEISIDDEIVIYRDKQLVLPDRDINDFYDRQLKRKTIPRVVDKENLPDNNLDHYADKPLKITFLTPTRIKHQQRLIEKTPHNGFDFKLLIYSIAWRAHLLAFFHHNSDIPKYEAPEIPPIEIVEKSLRWADWFHYSNRARTKVPTGGFMGEIIFKGEWQPFYHLLRLGEKIHIGKATTFGLGKFTVAIQK